MNLLSYEDALSHTNHLPNRHLLLGNGFSIACRPGVFVYGKLFEQADFSKLSPAVQKAFAALGTQDFERVIRALRDSSTLSKVYTSNPEIAESMAKDADGLRDVLVTTIADNHPNQPSDIADEEYACCRKFLESFKTIYTLNYDLLLYWAQMHVNPNELPTADDGFRKSENDYEAGYVVWESHNSHHQTTWFLHGALHLFDAGAEMQKFTWINTGIRLTEQIRSALNRDLYPVFVSEGSSREKLTRIKHNDYLAKAYRSFTEITGCLFIYGHSLAENDEHFLKKIERGKITDLYIGIYGDPTSVTNKAIISRADRMSSTRAMSRKAKPLNVYFYDSLTACVWKQ